ncbi:TPA: ead/Ea22-like family protein [Escherichia albertii]|nr:ead/Ea22-like family protein [Escherichia albertii]
MSKINYQALREKAEKATSGVWSLEYGEERFDAGDALIHREVVGYLPICRIEGAHPESGFDEDFQMEQQANAEFIAAFNPKVALALLDEINALEETRINDVCRIAELTKQLESAKSKLNEQREYYEGVISDGSKRIAELEKSEEQLINERDHAEYALADMYFAATGNRPEWSNWFGFSDAVDAVVDRIADLEAKQPSPVVPEEMYWQDAPVEGSSKAAAYATGCNACRADMLQGDEPVSNHEELPLDYLQGQKDGLEWAAQLAEANHPQTCDWLYDDPVELAKAIRKGPDMPEAAGNSPVTLDGWISCSERMPEDTKMLLAFSQGEIVAAYWNWVVNPIDYKKYRAFTYLSGNILDDVTHWMPLPEPPL